MFHQWQPFLSTHIYRITESRELTEEIVQDAFLKIWQTRETLPDVRNFRSYLIVISKHQGIECPPENIPGISELGEMGKGRCRQRRPTRSCRPILHLAG
ncbi:RNA polymerase sigma factor [Chitinophaga sedimenti]|uniref:RNA polymerase sigma factor n=1 Tax=Chitinophaga sedimenti TaxID=2033606 RepID=UPI003558748D